METAWTVLRWLEVGSFFIVITLVLIVLVMYAMALHARRKREKTAELLRNGISWDILHISQWLNETPEQVRACAALRYLSQIVRGGSGAVRGPAENIRRIIDGTVTVQDSPTDDDRHAIALVAHGTVVPSESETSTSEES